MSKYRDELGKLGNTSMIKRFTNGLVSDKEFKEKEDMASINLTRVCRGRVKRRGRR